MGLCGGRPPAHRAKRPGRCGQGSPHASQSIGKATYSPATAQGAGCCCCRRCGASPSAAHAAPLPGGCRRPLSSPQVRPARRLGLARPSPARRRDAARPGCPAAPRSGGGRRQTSAARRVPQPLARRRGAGAGRAAAGARRPWLVPAEGPAARPSPRAPRSAPAGPVGQLRALWGCPHGRAMLSACCRLSPGLGNGARAAWAHSPCKTPHVGLFLTEVLPCGQGSGTTPQQQPQSQAWGAEPGWPILRAEASHGTASVQWPVLQPRSPKPELCKT